MLFTVNVIKKENIQPITFHFNIIAYRKSAIIYFKEKKVLINFKRIVKREKERKRGSEREKEKPSERKDAIKKYYTRAIKSQARMLVQGKLYFLVTYALPFAFGS